jgi:hypothetical protein
MKKNGKEYNLKTKVLNLVILGGIFMSRGGAVYQSIYVPRYTVIPIPPILAEFRPKLAQLDFAQKFTELSAQK